MNYVNQQLHFIHAHNKALCTLMQTKYQIAISIFLFIITSLLTTSCHSSSDTVQEIQPTDSIHLTDRQLISQKDTIIKAEKRDDLIYDLIFALPEIKESEACVEQQTHGERHLKLMIIERPQTNGHNYYLVKAGEDDDIRFVTHFNFYIYPADNYEIKFYDPVKDTIINIDGWRKENKTK
jgi:hypothetical protein